MAKKRVHELAKQYDMPSAEVMKKLNAYGLKVKASASAVDEHEAERALTGKPPKQESNGKPDAAAKRQRRQQTGMGFDQPATETAQASGSPSASSASRGARRRPPKDRPDGNGRAEAGKADGDEAAGGRTARRASARRAPRSRASAPPAPPAACAAS